MVGIFPWQRLRPKPRTPHCLFDIEEANNELSLLLEPHTLAYDLGAALLLVTHRRCLSSGEQRASDDIPQVEGEAPAGQEALKHTRAGAYFVDTSLKEQYNRLLSRTKSLQADLDAERIGGAEALRELGDLQTKLQQLRDEIEKKKVLVQPGKLHKQSETTTFDLGPARLLFIMADDIRVEGWDGTQVKCVLDKTVVAADDKPVDEHLQGIKLVHRHGLAPNVVGPTPAELEAHQREFLASPDGQKLNEQQREAMLQTHRTSADSYNVYRAFQGKEIDTLEIEGLTYEQGNRNLSFEIRSGGTVRVVGSESQRYASLTVYVPTCQAVALRGAGENLDVEGLHGDLVVEGQGDAGYGNNFRIRDLHGSLTVRNVPLEMIESIHGNVNILSTITNGPTYTGMRDGERILATPAPRVLTCRNVDGDLVAWVTRDELNLDTIAGRIDVNNEFGKTTLVVGRALAERPHRVVSESGRIEVHLAPDRLGVCRFRP